MKVRFTLSASVDLDGSLSTIGQHSPRGAGRVKASIETATRLLESFPWAGMQTKLPWLRRMKAPSYPYLIFYEVTDREVIIHAVRHSARNPSTMPGHG